MSIPTEIKHGDGGYTIPGPDSDRWGDVLPLEEAIFDAVEEPSEHEDTHEADEAEIDEGKKSQQERFAYVKETYGFYPHSAAELSQMTGIDSARGKSAAKYLSVVMQHQQRAVKEDSDLDPDVVARTGRKIANDMIGYRDDARPTISFLGDLPFRVRDAGDQDGLRAEFTHMDEGTRRAFAQVMRRRDLDTFVSGEQTKGKHTFADYTPEAIDAFIAQADPHELQELATEVLFEERNRLSYWTEQVRDMKKVTVARPLAERALGEVTT